MQFTQRHLSTIRRFVTRLKIFLSCKFHWRNKERIIIIPWLIWTRTNFRQCIFASTSYEISLLLRYNFEFIRGTIYSFEIGLIFTKKKKKEKNRTARKLYFSTIVIFINLIQYLNCRYKPKIKFFSPSFNRFNDFNFLNFTPNLTFKPFRRNTLITLLDKPIIPIYQTIH